MNFKSLNLATLLFPMSAFLVSSDVSAKVATPPCTKVVQFEGSVAFKLGKKGYKARPDHEALRKVKEKFKTTVDDQYKKADPSDILRTLKIKNPQASEYSADDPVVNVYCVDNGAFSGTANYNQILPDVVEFKINPVSSGIGLSDTGEIVVTSVVQPVVPDTKIIIGENPRPAGHQYNASQNIDETGNAYLWAPRTYTSKFSLDVDDQADLYKKSGSTGDNPLFDSVKALDALNTFSGKKWQCGIEGTLGVAINSPKGGSIKLAGLLGAPLSNRTMTVVQNSEDSNEQESGSDEKKNSISIKESAYWGGYLGLEVSLTDMFSIEVGGGYKWTKYKADFTKLLGGDNSASESGSNNEDQTKLFSKELDMKSHGVFAGVKFNYKLSDNFGLFVGATFTPEQALKQKDTKKSSSDENSSTTNIEPMNLSVNSSCDVKVGISVKY